MTVSFVEDDDSDDGNNDEAAKVACAAAAFAVRADRGAAMNTGGGGI